MSHKECFVPTCKNNSAMYPNKIFVRIREDLRKKWCREVDAEYFNYYCMYCCEDHLNPREDLKNYYKYKLMNEEPVLKPTATLKNIHPKPIKQEPSVEPSEVHTEDSELKKLLLQSQPLTSVKKRKSEDWAIPSKSASTFPFKVQIGIQCTVKMVDKSTNYRPRKQRDCMYSTQEAATMTPSLVGFTTDTEENIIEQVYISQKRKKQKYMLDTTLKEPETYLGGSKPLQIMKSVCKKSKCKINLTFIALQLYLKLKDSIERISDQLELYLTKFNKTFFLAIEKYVLIPN